MNDFLMIVIQSSILILTLLIVRKLFLGKINPILQYSLWSIVALRLFVPINIESAFSIFNVAKPQEVERAIAPIIYNAIQSASSQNITVIQQTPVETISNAINSADPLGNSISTTQVIAGWLMFIWITGMAAMFIYTLIVNIKFYVYVKKNGVKEDGYYVCKNLTSPCLMGIFRPIIVLNTKSIQDEKSREYAILHEQTHIAHKDNIWAALRTLACIVYWFNPLVWIAVNVCRKDQEIACDYSVIKQIGEDNRKEYGQVLISLISKNKTLPALTTAMANNKKDIKERIIMITKTPKMLKLTAVVLAVVIITVSVIACTGAATQTGKNNILTLLSDTESNETSEAGKAYYRYSGDMQQLKLDFAVYINGVNENIVAYPFIYDIEDGLLDFTVYNEGVNADPVVIAITRGSSTQTISPEICTTENGFSMVGLTKETEVKSGERILLWYAASGSDGEPATYYDTTGLEQNMSKLREYDWAVLIYATFYDHSAINAVEPLPQQSETVRETASITPNTTNIEEINYNENNILHDLTNTDIGTKFASIIAKALSDNDLLLPKKELWVHQVAQFNDGHLVLAQFSFEGESMPHLFYIKDERVVSMSQGGDVWCLNYVKFAEKTIAYGNTFVNVIGNEIGDNTVITFKGGEKISCPMKDLSALKNQLKDSDNSFAVRPTYLCIASDDSDITSAITTDKNGKKIADAVDSVLYAYEGRAFSQNTMVDMK